MQLIRFRLIPCKNGEDVAAARKSLQRDTRDS